MCALIDYFVDHTNLPFLIEGIKSNNVTGGRPALDNRILLKMFMYAQYCAIPVRQIYKHDNISSEFKFLSHGIHHFPERTAYHRMLKTQIHARGLNPKAVMVAKSRKNVVPVPRPKAY